MAEVEGALGEWVPPLGPPHPLGSSGLGLGLLSSGRNGDLRRLVHLLGCRKDCASVGGPTTAPSSI